MSTDPRDKSGPNGKSPNPSIDRAIRRLMRNSKDKNMPPDTMVKILSTAIAWEKVKNAIRDKDDQFDPDNL